MVNMVCDHALWAGYQKGVKEIDSGIIKECVDKLPLLNEKIDDSKAQEKLEIINHGAPKEPAISSSREKVSIYRLCDGVVDGSWPSVLSSENLGDTPGIRRNTAKPNPQQRTCHQLSTRIKILASLSGTRERARRTVSDLKKESTPTRLVSAGYLLKEEKQTDDRPTAPAYEKKSGLSGSGDEIQRAMYTIYLHYSNEEQKELMEALADSLKNSGFGVIGIERVDYQKSYVCLLSQRRQSGGTSVKKSFDTLHRAFDQSQK